MSVVVLRGDARCLPLPDSSVDLVVTSPPYFGLRSYTDGCPACADRARAGNRGYMERYCPGCGKIRNRNVCPECGLTTLRTEATKAANRKTDCAECGGSGQLHYDGQIGSEATPAEYVAALVECTREWIRVLKPSGSIFVNLGDKYSQRVATRPSSHQDGLFPDRPELRKDWKRDRAAGLARMPYENVIDGDGNYVREKSLIGLPWRYALACTDQLGLILRAEIIWAKPNGLPESVTDRVRRAHEQVFHFTRLPRYYSAVDEIREPHQPPTAGRNPHGARGTHYRVGSDGLMTNGIGAHPTGVDGHLGFNPLGKLPGSVWDIASQPLTVPPSLGVDHFAAFPMELPRRIILGWSPPGVCTGCGEGRRPVSAADYRPNPKGGYLGFRAASDQAVGQTAGRPTSLLRTTTITGYACACPQPTAPTRRARVVDPFGGTGTTALVADVLGRDGFSFDMSMDYTRLARWRVNDPGERAKALEVPKPPPVPDGQGALFTRDEVAP